MLKKRIIPVMLLMGDRLVKTQAFDQWRDVGDPVKSAAVYNSQNADELVLLNIDRQQRSAEVWQPLIEKISEVSFMPLAVGGGIQSYEEAAFLISHGADKVVLNSVCYRQPELIQRLSEHFGSQAVVVSLDIGADAALYSDCGRRREDITVQEHLQRCETLGAGEFFVQSIAYDGAMTGYDMTLLEKICQWTSVPLVGCSGAGNYEHLKEAFLQLPVSGLACGSLFNFSDSNPIRAKNFLSNYQIPLKVV